MFTRIVTASAALVTLGWVTAQRALDRRVDRAARQATDLATQEARATVIERATDMAKSASIGSLKAYALRSALLIGGFVTLSALGISDRALMSWILGSALALLLFFDVLRHAPKLAALLRHLTAHRFRPRRALTDYVNAEVYRAVRRRADQRPLSTWERIAHLVTGRPVTAVHHQIAADVAADTARHTLQDLRPILTWAALNIAVFSAFYAGVSVIIFFAV